MNSVTRSVANINLRSNEAPSNQPASSAHSDSDANPARHVSNINSIPAAASNPPPSQESSFIRQNYAADVEAAINRQINIELHARFVSLTFMCEISLLATCI